MPKHGKNAKPGKNEGNSVLGSGPSNPDPEGAIDIAALGALLPAIDVDAVIDDLQAADNLPPPYSKGILLFDNVHSFGAGATRVGRGTAANDTDKIRWQEEALWSAYYKQDALPANAPGFVRKGDLGLVSDLGSRDPIFYAGPRVHRIYWDPQTQHHPNHWDDEHLSYLHEGMPEYNEDTTFGEYNQLFDLFIDVELFERAYGRDFNITAEELRAIPDGTDILDFDKFLTAIQELYGIYTNAGPRPVGKGKEGGYRFDRAEFTHRFLKRWSDHTTDIPALLTERQAICTNLQEGFAIVRPVYNYMMLDYERVLESSIKPAHLTHAIPNMYVLAKEALQESHNVQNESDFYYMATVGGLAPTFRPRQGERYSGRDYFCAWTHAVSDLGDLSRDPVVATTGPGSTPYSRFRHAADNFKNIMFRPDEAQFILAANGQRLSYPMFNEIRFPLSPQKSFANFFVDGLMNFFMRASIGAPQEQFNAYEFDFRNHSFEPYWRTTNTVLAPRSHRVTDVLKYWTRFDNPNEIAALEQELHQRPDMVFLGANEETRALVQTPELRQPVIRYRFLSRLRRQVQRHTRRYRELLRGHRAKSETVYYRIEKTLNGSPVQNFFVPNDEEFDVFEYIDTQVMYGMSPGGTGDFNRYNYTIYAGQMVMGTDYSRNIYARPSTDGKSPAGIPSDEWNFPFHDPRGVPHPSYGPLQTVRPDGSHVVEQQPEAPATPGAPLGRIDEGVDVAIGLDEYEQMLLRQVADGIITPQQAVDRFQAERQRRVSALGQHAGAFQGPAPDPGYTGMRPADPRTDIAARQAEWLENFRDRLDMEIGYFHMDADHSDNPGRRIAPPEFGDPLAALVSAGHALAGNQSDGRRRMVRIRMLANIQPAVKIIEVPVFSTGDVRELALLDKPPAPPDIDVIPYQNVDNQLLFNMNEQANTHIEALPIAFTSTEQHMANFWRDQQAANGIIPPGKGCTDNWDNIPIIFGNDDHPSSYEVYRLETPPESYEDFAGKLHHIADLTAGSKDGEALATSASLKDALLPNRKYYYTFRVKDSHGHISNPSAVYQIELVNNAGAVYLLLDTYSFPEKKAVNYTEDVQQYIKIKPSFLQGLVDQERSGLVLENGELAPTAKFKTIHLGLAEEAVWGRKFKFRFISKKTGRKLDINVDIDFEGVTHIVGVAEQEDIGSLC